MNILIIDNIPPAIFGLENLPDEKDIYPYLHRKMFSRHISFLLGFSPLDRQCFLALVQLVLVRYWRNEYYHYWRDWRIFDDQLDHLNIENKNPFQNTTRSNERATPTNAPWGAQARTPGASGGEATPQVKFCFSFFIAQQFLQITLSVQTERTGCSLIIVFFSFKFCDFSELCQFCCSVGVLPVGVCTHTDTEGKQRKARVQNIFKKSEKTQYLMNNLYIHE